MPTTAPAPPSLPMSLTTSLAASLATMLKSTGTTPAVAPVAAAATARKANDSGPTSRTWARVCCRRPRLRSTAVPALEFPQLRQLRGLDSPPANGVWSWLCVCLGVWSWLCVCLGV